MAVAGATKLCLERGPPVDAAQQEPEADRGADHVRHGDGRHRQPRLHVQGEQGRQHTADAEPGHRRDGTGEDGDEEDQPFSPHGLRTTFSSSFTITVV
jgi:hypothetical protein